MDSPLSLIPKFCHLPPPASLINYRYLAKDPDSTHPANDIQQPPEISNFFRWLVCLPDCPACGRIRIALFVLIHWHLQISVFFITDIYTNLFSKPVKSVSIKPISFELFPVSYIFATFHVSGINQFIQISIFSTKIISKWLIIPLSMTGV